MSLFSGCGGIREADPWDEALRFSSSSTVVAGFAMMSRNSYVPASSSSSLSHSLVFTVADILGEGWLHGYRSLLPFWDYSISGR